MRSLFGVMLLFVLAGQGNVHAQSAPAIRGTVVDDTGSPVPGATVVLAASDGQNPWETITDRDGRFVFADVPPGAIRLRVELSGFRPAELKATVERGRTAEITARLNVGFEEEVTVTAESASVLSPSRNADAIQFDSEALRRLPTDAQDLQAIMEQFAAAGPVGGASVVIDGVETSSLRVPMAAVHRLTINRNPYAAEFKSPGKGRIEVETERGSRRFYHGSGAMFVRNSALDAANALSRTRPDQSRALNEGTLGGPLPGKGWSFFAAGQHLVDNDAAVVNAQTLAGTVVQNVATPDRRTVALGRVDYRPNKTDALTIRYDLFDDVEQNHGVGGIRLPDQAYPTIERRHRAQINDHRITDRSVLNDLRVELVDSRRQDGTMPARTAVFVHGAFMGGASQRFTGDGAKSMQVEDIASTTVAGQPIRFGGRMKRRWIDATDGSNFGGTFEFASLADFARGAPLLFTQRSGNADAAFTDVDGSAFAETSLRPFDGVGITAGLRYEWQAAVRDWNNVAPRLAVAVAPAGRKTVLRGGIGYFYQSLGDQAIARGALFGAGGVRERTVARPHFPLTPPEFAITGASSVWRIDPALVEPSVLQASIGVERALWRKTSVTAEYLRLRTSHAFRAVDVNAALSADGPRPDATLLNVFQIESTGSSRADAMTLTFNGRIVGFRGTVQYVLARAVDDASGVFDLPADSRALRLESGRADFDRRHRLNVAGTYGFRKDRVRIGAVLAASSSMPYDITTGGDENGDLIANDRPAGVTRNTGEGPAFAQLDLRFTKVFRLPRPASADPESRKREQADNFELNADLFNALNHLNATRVIGVMSSPLFGRPEAARMPRTLQISARYRF